MKLVKPSYEVWPVAETVPEILRQIEQAGRTCYKSEAKITENSAFKFVNTLIKKKHESVLEHSNFIFRVTPHMYQGISAYKPKYLRLTSMNGNYLISGNARAFRDFIRQNQKRGSLSLNELGSALSWTSPELFGDIADYGQVSEEPPELVKVVDLTEAEKFTHEIRTVKIICDRGISHELVRHRGASFSQESTRYCDYDGGHITFVLPPWVKVEPRVWELVDSSVDWYCLPDEIASRNWLVHMNDCEETYKELRKQGWIPEQARSVLPNSLKTEIVMTQTLGWWYHFFSLRVAIAAHPQMREIAEPMFKDFQQSIPRIFDNLQ